MNTKLIIGIIILFISVFTVSMTVVNANIKDFIFPEKQTMIVILKNETDMTTAKAKISKIPKIKITGIQDRNKEWSKMVNKMDLPKMDNPFKNEFIIKVNKNADITDISNKLKSMDIVEDVKCEHVQNK